MGRILKDTLVGAGVGGAAGAGLEGYHHIHGGKNNMGKSINKLGYGTTVAGAGIGAAGGAAVGVTHHVINLMTHKGAKHAKLTQ